MIGEITLVGRAIIDPTDYDWLTDIGIKPYPVYYDTANKRFKRMTDNNSHEVAGFLMWISSCDNTRGVIAIGGVIPIIIPAWKTPYFTSSTDYYIGADWNLTTTNTNVYAWKSVIDAFNGVDTYNFQIKPNVYNKNEIDAKDTATLNTAKAYADALVVWLFDDRWNYNASSNTYPTTWWSSTSWAVLKGDVWTISVAWTLWGVAVTAGDVLRALVDTPWQTSSNRVITENNLWYVPENVANKATDLTSPNNTKYPTTQAVSNALALKANDNAVVHLTWAETISWAKSFEYITSRVNNTGQSWLSLQNWDAAGSASDRRQVSFWFSGSNDYAHFIHSRHNWWSATNNFLDFYICDWTQTNSITTWSNLALQVWADWSFIVGAQNRTSNWTGYTPTLTSAWWSNFGISLIIARYKQIWKIVFLSVKLQITSKTWVSGSIWLTVPVPTTSTFEPVNWFLVASWANPATSAKWDAETDNWVIRFKKWFATARMDAADCAVGDYVSINWMYCAW